MPPTGILLPIQPQLASRVSQALVRCESRFSHKRFIAYFVVQNRKYCTHRLAKIYSFNKIMNIYTTLLTTIHDWHRCYFNWNATQKNE